MFFMLPVTSLLLLPLFVIAVPAALVVWWAARRRHCRRDAAPVAVRHGGRAGPALKWVMVVVVGALLLVLALRAQSRHVREVDTVRYAQVAPVHPSSPPPARAGDGPGSAWLPEVETSFEASLYPSKTAAARALGHRLAARLGEVVAEGEAPSPIRIGGSDDDGAGIIRRQVAEVLRAAVEGARVVLAAAAAPQTPEAAGPVGIRVEIALEAERDAEPGRIAATLVGGGSAFCEVRFIDKPWVVDFDAYRSGHMAREDLVGRSPGFASSAAEAERAAMTDAARRLAPLVAERMRAGYRGAHRRNDPDQLASGILAAMQSGQSVVDRFVQRLHRPYGAVWRAAVLADASGGAVDAHARRMTRAAVVTRRAALGSWATLLGLVVLVCVLYLFLSAVTKGYYDRPLCVLLGLVVVAGIVLLL